MSNCKRCRSLLLFLLERGVGGGWEVSYLFIQKKIKKRQILDKKKEKALMCLIFIKMEKETRYEAYASIMLINKRI